MSMKEQELTDALAGLQPEVNRVVAQLVERFEAAFGHLAGVYITWWFTLSPEQQEAIRQWWLSANGVEDTERSGYL